MPHPPDGLLLGHGRHDLLLRVTPRMNQERVTPPRKPVLRTRQSTILSLGGVRNRRIHGGEKETGGGRGGQGGRGERSEG